MVDALNAVISEIHRDNANEAIDALAVSLSSEFLAKAALEAPKSIRSLALISPTGFRQSTTTHGPPNAHCGRPGMYSILKLPVLGRSLYNILTTAPSLRFFLRKTWGSRNIDEQMFSDSQQMTRHPGAHRAPFYFLSGYLTSADIRSVFDALPQPVWLSHGVRGDFTDFSRTDVVAHKSNWRITVFQTGALPYFEQTQAFIKAYDDFLAQAAAGRAVNNTVVESETGTAAR